MTRALAAIARWFADDAGLAPDEPDAETGWLSD